MPAVAENDVGADRERSGSQPLRQSGRLRASVDTDLPEVAAESGFEKGARCRPERLAPAPQARDPGGERGPDLLVLEIRLRLALEDGRSAVRPAAHLLFASGAQALDLADGPQRGRRYWSDGRVGHSRDPLRDSFGFLLITVIGRPDRELRLHRAERMRDGEVAQAGGSSPALARAVRRGLGLWR